MLTGVDSKEGGGDLFALFNQPFTPSGEPDP